MGPCWEPLAMASATVVLTRHRSAMEREKKGNRSARAGVSAVSWCPGVLGKTSAGAVDR